RAPHRVLRPVGLDPVAGDLDVVGGVVDHDLLYAVSTVDPGEHPGAVVEKQRVAGVVGPSRPLVVSDRRASAVGADLDDVAVGVSDHYGALYLLEALYTGHRDGAPAHVEGAVGPPGVLECRLRGRDLVVAVADDERAGDRSRD